MIDIKAIKARCDKATPGPWRTGNGFSVKDSYQGRDTVLSDSRFITDKTTYGTNGDEEVFNNMDFIAHSREDIQLLLEELDSETKRADLAEADKNILIFRNNNADKMFVEALEDRNRWKARSKALEQVMKEAVDPCEFCTFNKGHPLCNCCREHGGDEDNWEFDEARLRGDGLVSGNEGVIF